MEYTVHQSWRLVYIYPEIIDCCKGTDLTISQSKKKTLCVYITNHTIIRCFRERTGDIYVQCTRDIPGSYIPVTRAIPGSFFFISTARYIASNCPVKSSARYIASNCPVKSGARYIASNCPVNTYVQYMD